MTNPHIDYPKLTPEQIKERQDGIDFMRGKENSAHSLDIKGWERNWELTNSQIKDGVNPHAYRLGFLDATEIFKPSVTEESQEELWEKVWNRFMNTTNRLKTLEQLENDFTITRKTK
jgi:hypothetical protein